MTWLRLAFANLRLSPLTSAVNAILMGLGTASIVLLLLAGAQLSQTLSRDAKSIDLVLGATGSPVQLVLSAVYHADVPPGNILQSEAERWADDSRVDVAIPLSLGDSYRGLRIVGTTEAYAELYGGALAAGRFWSGAMEAVAGSAAAEAAGLVAGTQFAGAHGLVEGGHSHQARPYRVVGVLEPTGTVLDRLILTSLESVWDLHGEEEPPARASGMGREAEHDQEHEAGHTHSEDQKAEHVHKDDHDEHSHAEPGHPDTEREITAMLIRYRSPLAAMTLPREVNASGSLQAAAPAMEISRILQLVGVGMDGLKAFSWMLVVTAALSVFAALYGSLRARRGDLAMLRCLGATRWELLWVLLMEGLLLSAFGIALGFLAGHGAMELLGGWLESTRGVAMTGWIWVPAETLLLLGLFGIGGIAATIPAVQAYRTDVARTLAEG